MRVVGRIDWGVRFCGGGCRPQVKYERVLVQLNTREVALADNSSTGGVVQSPRTVVVWP